MAPGGMPPHSESPLGARILLLKVFDSLVALAEAFGVVAAENPEQGYVGSFDPRRERALPDLVVELERATGGSLAFPPIGAAYGLAVEGRLITAETPDQVYTAVRLGEAIGLHLSDRGERGLRMVEIGGGYGGGCYWLLSRQPEVVHYTIVDLATVNVLQGYFLAQALGADAVSFFGEPQARVAILPNHALAEVETPYDVLFNKDSMPEMPYETMVSYLEWARANCEGFFYSNNHEARAPFLEYSQGRVPDAIAQVGGFRRLSREQSWVRPGYVEEIYRRVEVPRGDGGVLYRRAEAPQGGGGGGLHGRAEAPQGGGGLHGRAEAPQGGGGGGLHGRAEAPQGGGGLHGRAEAPQGGGGGGLHGRADVLRAR